MKFAPVLVAMSTLLAGAAFAQKAPAPAVPDAAATVKAVCKDGTPFEGTTLRGACRGHGGVDKAASAGTPAVAATPAKPAVPAALAVAAKPAAPASRVLMATRTGANFMVIHLGRNAWKHMLVLRSAACGPPDDSAWLPAVTGTCGRGFRGNGAALLPKP